MTPSQTQQELQKIQALLQKHAVIAPEKAAYFFKTGPESYSAHDQFRGISAPALRKIARLFPDLAHAGLQILLDSKINEDRLLALMILVDQYQKAPASKKDFIYDFYLKNLGQVNNWNLVDSSAAYILGAHLSDQDRGLLRRLADSQNLWERRIAIVSTHHFIKHNDLLWTFQIAEQLLSDKADLIHKATGWMLREAGKRDTLALEAFLRKNGACMPRTMLRYAIEKFDPKKRKQYLTIKKKV